MVGGGQQPVQGGEQGGYGLGRAELGEQPDGVQGVGGAQLIGGEGGGGAGGARVAEAGEGAGGAGAADRVAVVEEHDQRFEGAPVTAHPQRVGGDLPRPQRASGFDEYAREVFPVLGGAVVAQQVEHALVGPHLRRGAQLSPYSFQQRTEFLFHFPLLPEWPVPQRNSPADHWRPRLPVS